MSATQSPSNNVLYRFGPYEIDLARNDLRKFGLPVRLERKPWQVLVALLDRPGELVTRSDLQKLLWSDDVFVDFEAGLNVAIKKARVALSDSAEEPRYIETVPGLGYRFIADVETISALPGPMSATTDEGILPFTWVIHRDSPFRSNLRRSVPVGICATLLIALAVTVGWWRGAHLGAAPRKIMLVVLPFQNLSGDPTQEYLSDGMTEELSTQLGNANPSQLGVIGRTSAMAYKHTEHTISQIGKELAVGYILEGSVRRDGNQVRVTAQLVKVSDQAHLWAANYDESFGSLIQLENNLAAAIARQVGVSIAINQAQGSAKPHVPSSEAHEAYLRGRYYWYKRSDEGWKAAEDYFRLAIEKDPDYAAAYAGLAECHIPANQAQATALKAIALDPSSGEAYSALAWVQLYRFADPAAAQSPLKRAIELSPNYAQAHHTYANELLMTDHPYEAVGESRKAVALDPRSPLFNSVLAEALVAVGRLDDADEKFKFVVELDPQFAVVHEALGDIYSQEGKYREALAEYEEFAKLGNAPLLGETGYAYGRLGNTTKAANILKQLNKQPGAGIAWDAILVELGLGHNENAAKWLQELYAERDENLLWIKVDKRLSPLHNDPRYQALVGRMNFPQ